MTTAGERVSELEAENLRLRAQISMAQAYARYYAICKIDDKPLLSFEQWYWQKAGMLPKEKATR